MAQISVGIAVLISFAIKFSMPMDILWHKMEGCIPENRHNISQVLLRASCILIMGTISVAIPKLDPLFAITGGVFFSFLGILFGIISSV